MEPLIIFAVFFFFILMSMVLHEFGHAGVAYLCGDRTAYEQGRITLNPISHIDPFLTILLPILTAVLMGIPFGGARPVPVVVSNLRNPTRDDRLVTLAGPAANVLIAVVGALVFHATLSGASVQELTESAAASVLLGLIFVNVILVIFNLLPVPPLDGSHILASFLPANVADHYRRVGFFGMIILILLLQVGLGGWILGTTVQAIEWLGIGKDTWIPSVQKLMAIPGELFS